MRWKLIYKNEALGQAWRRHFNVVDNVEVLEGDICQVECDGLVSPANSFGFMDGGLDYSISERLGWDLQKQLQAEIAKRPVKELLVGEALILPTGDPNIPWLISAPTMRVPMRLRQTVNAYIAMKAILSVVTSHTDQPKINTVAIPGLGTGCGALPPDIAALQMWTAYKEVVLGEIAFPEIFSEAQKRHYLLNPNEINIWDPDSGQRDEFPPT